LHSLLAAQQQGESSPLIGSADTLLLIPRHETSAANTAVGLSRRERHVRVGDQERAADCSTQVRRDQRQNASLIKM
jgi:hypothetical protein